MQQFKHFSNPTSETLVLPWALTNLFSENATVAAFQRPNIRNGEVFNDFIFENATVAAFQRPDLRNGSVFNDSEAEIQYSEHFFDLNLTNIGSRTPDPETIGIYNF